MYDLIGLSERDKGAGRGFSQSPRHFSQGLGAAALRCPGQVPFPALGVAAEALGSGCFPRGAALWPWGTGHHVDGAHSPAPFNVIASALVPHECDQFCFYALLPKLL